MLSITAEAIALLQNIEQNFDELQDKFFSLSRSRNEIDPLLFEVKLLIVKAKVLLEKRNDLPFQVVEKLENWCNQVN